MQSFLEKAQIIDDLDEFVQREGLITNKLLIRSKLRLLSQITELGKTKTRIRGLLIRLNKLDKMELTLRVLDIIKTLSKKCYSVKSNRKLTLIRMAKPKDLLPWFTDESYPLRLDYM